MGMEKVLFLTKKKAMGSIKEDSMKLCPSYELFIINYESMHKLPKIDWDLIIIDEAHTLGAFPKPSKRAKDVRDYGSWAVRHPYVGYAYAGVVQPDVPSGLWHHGQPLPSVQKLLPIW